MGRQIIRTQRINQPSETEIMPAVAVAYDFSDDELPQHFVGVIDDIEGRERTARLIGIGSGTLENLRRGRRKSISLGLYIKIREAALRAIDKKIRRLEETRKLAFERGVSPDDRRICSVTAALARLEKLSTGE